MMTVLHGRLYSTRNCSVGLLSVEFEPKAGRVVRMGLRGAGRR